MKKADIIVYGAGDYATRYVNYVHIVHPEIQIKYFLVTARNPRQTCFMGKDVFSFEEKKEELSGAEVVVAISPKTSKGIADLLKKAGVWNYTQMKAEDFLRYEDEIFHYYERKPLNGGVAFWNFWGLGFFDNGKWIALKLHEIAPEIKLYWIISGEGNTEFPDWVTPVLEDTTAFYEVFCTVSVFVSNVNYPMFSYKRKDQFFISTWHGMGPLKKLDLDIEKNANNEKYKCERLADWNRGDLMIAGSDFCVRVYRGSFGYQGTIEKWGYPRNDIFFRQNDCKEKIFKIFDVPKNHKVVLYAPTFRNEIMIGGDKHRLQEIYSVRMGEVRQSLQKRFQCEFTIFYRFHHYVYRYVTIDEYRQEGIDVTSYQDMQELLVAADVLITDYSSSMWDFSLMRKPVFLYFHDAKDYDENYQGFYVFPDQYPYPKGHTTEELCYAIENFDDETYQRDIAAWFETYGTYDDGNAAKRVSEKIIDVLRLQDTEE